MSSPGTTKKSGVASGDQDTNETVRRNGGPAEDSNHHRRGRPEIVAVNEKKKTNQKHLILGPLFRKSEISFIRTIETELKKKYIFNNVFFIFLNLPKKNGNMLYNLRCLLN
jgi:hypothetical protein